MITASCTLCGASVVTRTVEEYSWWNDNHDKVCEGKRPLLTEPLS